MNVLKDVALPSTYSPTAEKETSRGQAERPVYLF